MNLLVINKMPAGDANYTVVEVEEETPRSFIIPKPEGLVFDSEESAKYGQLFTVRMKAEKDSEDKLCITEIEGIPTDYEEE